MIRKYLFFSLCIFPFHLVYGQREMKNIPFVQRDTMPLMMDIYYPVNLQEKNTTIIFLFGGGFKSGSRSDQNVTDYCKTLSDSGFIVAAIDYRLGLKNMKGMGLSMLKPLRNAINMAVEDLYSATGYLLANAQKLKIDPERIIINGSSAGAVTVLQADYELTNIRKEISALPSDFRYAGVISFAGAILSYRGKPRYKDSPAPTFFIHGTEDKLVFYNKKQIFWLGFFGSSALVKRFEKSNHPYCMYRYRDMGHEIAEEPFKRNIRDIIYFIQEYVDKRRPLRVDVTIKDDDLKRSSTVARRPKDLYK